MRSPNVGGADRWGRVAAGILLMSGGWRRGRGWPLLLAAGAQLLRTAYTQYCPVNQKLGINTHREKDRTLVASEKPVVQETSEESFPASDPPAWTSGGTSSVN